jgi:hypothetical protein
MTWYQHSDVFYKLLIYLDEVIYRFIFDNLKQGSQNQIDSGGSITKFRGTQLEENISSHFSIKNDFSEKIDNFLAILQFHQWSRSTLYPLVGHIWSVGHLSQTTDYWFNFVPKLLPVFFALIQLYLMNLIVLELWVILAKEAFEWSHAP